MTRHLWYGIAAIAALAMLTGADLAKERTQGEPTRPVRHLVVIIQENISFDHYFATYPRAANLPGEPVFIARDGTPSINGLDAGLLTNNPNSFQPFMLNRTQQRRCGPSPAYTAEQRAFNHGLMDKFPQFTGQISNTDPPCDFGLGANVVMGYYDGNTVTALWSYAQHFAMSDNFFGTTFGQSSPGHVNIISGQTHGLRVARAGADIDSVIVDGTMAGPGGPAFDDCAQPTGTLVELIGLNIGDLMNAKGITWGSFYAGFRPTSRNADGSAVCRSSHTSITGIATSDYIPGYQPFQKYASTANPHHLPPSSAAMIGHTDQANHQYDLTDFWDAAKSGNLPAVSFLKAASYQTGHAQASSPLDEQAFLVETINHLQVLPEWETMAVIITYDDSGGWYDHVMPPIVSQSNTHLDALTGDGSCGTAAPGAYQGRCGYGPRMPLLIISPWAKVNYVDHGVTNQTSILRFIEDNWDLGRIGDQSFDERAGSLLPLFDFRARQARKLFLDPATGQPVDIIAGKRPSIVYLSVFGQ